MSRATRTGQGPTTVLPAAGIQRPLAYTPTVTWAGNTITTQSGFYLKTPGLLLVWVSFIESAGTANAAITITLPAGYTVVTHTGSLAVGIGFVYSGSASTQTLTAASGATASVTTPVATGQVATYTAFMQIPTLT